MAKIIIGSSNPNDQQPLHTLTYNMYIRVSIFIFVRTKRGVVFYSYANITRVSRTTYYIVRFYTHFLSFDAPTDFAFIEIPIFILCIDSIFVRLRCVVGAW